MARITYGNALPAWQPIGDQFGFSGQFTNTTKTHAMWVDADNGNHIVIEGEKLKFEDGGLVSGTVTKVIFEDFEGADFGVFKGEFDAKKFAGIESEHKDYLIARLSSGDDTVIGTTHNDYLEGHNGRDLLKGGAGSDALWGGRGNDTLVGGSGSDYFWFNGGSDTYKGDGNDVIKNFDADGSDGSQDYLSLEGEILSIHKEGHDVVIELEKGSFTLLDVKYSQINAEDFQFPG